MEKVECYGCHDGRFVYKVVSQIGEFLRLIPKNDTEHRKLISRAMFLAANVEVFGTMAAAIIVLLFIVRFLRWRRRRRA